MWIEIRNFYEFVTTFTDFDDDDKLDDFFIQIEKYRWRLTNILTNPQYFKKRTSNDREKIKPNETIEIAGIELAMDKLICSEAIILSECFELNEIEAVDLVLSGEAQKIHFEGMNRGLIGVVCYYDAHRLLISTIRHMLKWDREDLPLRVSQFLENTFLTEGIVKQMFQKLSTFTVQSEFARLQHPDVNGIGGSKHQKMLKSAIEETRTELIACISLICEFPGSCAVPISNYLFSLVKAVPAERLNATNLTAWISLVKLTSSEVLVQDFLVQDAQQVLTNMISHIRNETDWSDQSMCGTLQLACAVSLKSIATSPSDHLGIENIRVDVERIIDRAIRNMGFQYLRHAIIGSEHFRYAHQFITIDELLKQFVSNFPAKLLETERNSADELFSLDDQQKEAAAATSSSKKPDPRNQTIMIDKLTCHLTTTDSSGNYETALSNYENFLRCFVDLYEMQVNDFSYQRYAKTNRERELHEQIEESSMSFSTERSIELCRLLERSRLRDHHVIHTVAYLELCAAVCRNRLTAGLLYDIFSKEHGGPDAYGWDYLSSALKGYERLFRDQKSLNVSRYNQSQTISMNTSYQQNQPPLNINIRPGDRIHIQAQELSGLLAWVRMATKVAQFNDNAAMRFSDDPSWTMSNAVASLATSSVPLSLKAALIGLLTAVARLKGTAPRIWHVIHINKLSYHGPGEVLMGMQEELEQRECIEKDYSVSLAFVKLMTTLLMHRTMPDYSLPFIQYVTRSILALFLHRSYNSIIQMWELAEWALRATNALLEFGIIEPRAVAQNDAHICILTQLLNDTPMFRAITRVLMEDCQAHNDPYTSRQAPSSDAALIALRILSRAIILHPALRACARVSSSDIMVQSISSLVFAPVISSSRCTLFDLIFHYIHMTDDFPMHSLYAARMWRDVMATRGAVEAKMLEILRTRDSAASHCRAIRSAVCADAIQYTIDDSLCKDEDTDNPLFARGETARLVLETLSDAIDSHVVRSRNKVTDFKNVVYYLLAFRPSRANSKELYEVDDPFTGIHYVLHIIEQFVQSKTPFDLPFSALIEPAFRLMQRLVATSCPFSQPVLCFMRSSNIIEQLTTSPFICSALKMESDEDNTYAQGVFAVRRMIVGYILHFSAVEISNNLTTGHFSRPEKLYRALLESSSHVAQCIDEDMEDNDEYVTVDTRPAGSTDSPNLLFSLLRRASVPRKNELAYPTLVHFDVAKLREIFDACLTVNIYGVAQYDVLYLNRLMRREIEIVYTDASEMRYVQKELEDILEYCTEINASLLSESASERIVSGCTALLDVFTVFAPVHFFSNKMQLILFRDACYVLIEMCSGVGGASLLSACQTFHRLVLTVTKLAKIEYPKLLALRLFFAPLFKSMIELFLQPGEKCVDAKIQLYKTMRYILRTLFEKDCIDVISEAEGWLLDGLIQPPNILSSDEIVNIVDQMGDEIARHLEGSIADTPKHRKAAVIMLANDLIHEDLKNNKKVCNHIARSGVPRILCEELLGIDFDWNIVTSAKKEGRVGGVSHIEHISNYKLFYSILTFFTRFAQSESGWIALTELGAIEIFAEMPAFTEPPKELFLKPETVKTKGTAAHAYAKMLDLGLHFAAQMCTKTKWKKQSWKVVAFVQRFGEVFQQLMRAEVQCECLEIAKALIYEISLNDDALLDDITRDQVLNQLRKAEEAKEVKSNAKKTYINVNPGCAAPRQLYSTVQPF